MNNDNLIAVINEIKENVRVYRVYTGNGWPSYKVSTLVHTTDRMLSMLYEKFKSQPYIRITENNMEIYKKAPQPSKPKTFLSLHANNAGILEWRTGTIFQSVEHILETNFIKRHSVIYSLKKSERGIKARFKFIKLNP